MLALGEMAATYPVAGAFYDYAVRFIDPAWGFAIGWNYVINWLVVLPFELTVVAQQILYWIPDNDEDTSTNSKASWLFPLLVTANLTVVSVVSFLGSG